MKQNPVEILDTMLGYLGFACEYKVSENEKGLSIQVYTPESDKLIGRHGETLEDIQFLLNRILQTQNKRAPKVYLDIEHFRQMRDDNLLARVKDIGNLVRQTGRPYHLDPMNSYDRRIVHNAFKDDPDVESISPSDDARLKRITLRPRAGRQ